MATEAFVITSTEWTRITTPGESGNCWKKTGGTILVDHTISTAATLPTSSGAVTIEKSKRVPLDDDSNNVLGLPADGATDSYFAIAHNSDLSNKIVVDAI